jgi:hypothetical protein
LLALEEVKGEIKIGDSGKAYFEVLAVLWCVFIAVLILWAVTVAVTR